MAEDVNFYADPLVENVSRVSRRVRGRCKIQRNTLRHCYVLGLLHRSPEE